MFREVQISDVTMKELDASRTLNLTFREKLEISKLLDHLGVDAIEVEGIESKKRDSLRIKSIATAVKDSVVAVPVKLDAESVSETWDALKEARHPRLQVVAALSPAVMEYVYKLKQPGMLEAVKDTVQACCAICGDVEFIADDATRSDPAFLYQAIDTAIEAGASLVTVSDTAGKMLPEEFVQFLKELKSNVPALENVKLGVSCSDELSMADVCVIDAIGCGVSVIKAAAYEVNTARLAHVAKIISAKQDDLEASTRVHITQIKRVTNQIRWICESDRSEGSPFENGVQDEVEEIGLTANDDIAAVVKAVENLGYDLSEEDKRNVYDAFLEIAKQKDSVGSKELDAIVASAAMQVPSTYLLVSYVINAGNVMGASSHIKVKKDDQELESICIGDGPVDASFLAIEQIIGHHYELEDFQISAITEGHEAMGQAVVKLRSDANGKLYSGRGVSTDILGSCIRAYLNALNKIVYEEQ